MSDLTLLGADAVAMLVLTFLVYFPRYRRPDMVLSIMSINVGVVAVATVLSRADVTAGLGLGLFGVLSIIRLRSQELDQEEVAYYFSALALGLLGGIRVTPDWIAPTLMAAIVDAVHRRPSGPVCWSSTPERDARLGVHRRGCLARPPRKAAGSRYHPTQGEEG